MGLSLSHNKLRTVAHLHIVLLAAGGSRRLGRPKALVRLAGMPLVRRQSLKLLALRPAALHVVLGAKASRIAATLGDLPVRLIRHRHWKLGQGTSVAAAVKTLPVSAHHLLVIAVDQFQLHEAPLRRLLLRAGPTPIATDYHGRAGIPVIFPRRWFDRLKQLSGDRGAGSQLTNLNCQRVTIKQASLDLDTPEQLRQAQRLSLRGGLGSPRAFRPHR